MQYHALALASSLAEVDVVGYAGSTPHPAVQGHGHISWHFLRLPSLLGRPDPPRWLFLGYALLKVLGECLQLSWLLLCVVRKPDVILVQNPPAIPTLLVALVMARVRRAKLVVDWHNFGYTMLALRLGQCHPVVRLARWYESTVGRYADAHLCVSQAMQAALGEYWGIAGASVLYDRPAACFAPTLPHVRQDLFHRLQDTIAFAIAEGQPEVTKGLERPALLVSPTSWTADEDFSMLLDAALQCDAMIRAHEEEAAGRLFPHLLILITGKGPLRSHYEAQIARLALRKLHLRTLWLAAEDYARLLGAADAGICLHRSSSGLDLPMKLADMFGSGLPVCALDYGPCLAEQVQHGKNGLLFSTSEQLAAQLYTLFKDFPDDSPLLNQLRRNVNALSCQRWADEWREVAQPVFSALCPTDGF
jgi:beta-1,4-mannosyltransferase